MTELETKLESWTARVKSLLALTESAACPPAIAYHVAVALREERRPLVIAIFDAALAAGRETFLLVLRHFGPPEDTAPGPGHVEPPHDAEECERALGPMASALHANNRLYAFMADQEVRA